MKNERQPSPFPIEFKEGGRFFINYVYHMVPKRMIGEKLIPLNKLKTKQEKLYNEYAEKYYDHKERVKLLERRIARLNCFWKDIKNFLHIISSRDYNAIKEASS